MRYGVWLVAEGLGFKNIAEFGGFTFVFGQHMSVRRFLTFRVLAYSQDQLIGKEIWYLKFTSLV